MKGTANPSSKLTDETASEALRLYATGDYTIRDLATKYGVGHATMTSLLRRRTWRHL